MNKQIIVVPRNTISAEQAQKIEEAGYLLIECDEPEKIVLPIPGGNLDYEKYFKAALGAISKHLDTQTSWAFIKNLSAALECKE